MKTPLDWPSPKKWQTLWPALKGSLAQIFKPCIRPNCPQCLAGTKHPAFILSSSQKGKRRCMYVPAELVPWLRRALKNGRRLEELLSAQGPLMLKHYRQKRDREQMPGSGKTPPPSKSTTREKANKKTSHPRMPLSKS